MYKTVKSMAQALAEARAYRDPVVEDKGFSSQQIKMAYGILNDPRYKQGNYSGAVKAIEKIANGLSNHPDVANALRRANEEVKEALDFDYAIIDGDNKIIRIYKAGETKHYGNILDDMQRLAREIPNNKKPLKIVVVSKKKVGDTVLGIGEEITEETYQLSERDLLKLINKTGFSKADFKTNENDNDHSLNAIMLARAFGTPQEFKDMIDIDKRHKERGSINEPDYQKRNALVKKYYPRLK